MKTRNATFAKQRGLNITRLLARDGKFCSWCGHELDRKITDERHPLYVTFDHVIPVSKGGLDQLINLRLMHAHCNVQRGAEPFPRATARERTAR